MSQHFAKLEQKQHNEERIGKIIVAVIAVLNLLSPIVNVVIDFRLGTLLSLLLAAILSAALFSGVTWIRYLFAFAAGCNVFYFLFILLGGWEFTSAHTWIILLLSLQLLYSVAACLLLLFNKSVKEFLYRQKNG